MYNQIFKEIKIKGLTLKNRIVFSAVGTHEPVEGLNERGVTDKLIAYHVARVKGGCSLNTIEACSVDKRSSARGMLSLAEDIYIDGFKKLNDAIHKAGGKSCAQLYQAGITAFHDRNAEILLPMDMPFGANYTVKGISNERLLEIIDAYGKATKRAVLSGVDAIEFHCAHNYLPHTMLSEAFNKRNDEWGGSFENREKFPLMCIKEIRKNMPENMPLFMRISCHDDFLPNGMNVEDIIRFCKDAKLAGVDVLNVSRGNVLSAASMYEVAPVSVPNGFNLSDTKKIKQETGMITMACGRMNTPELAEQALEEGDCDLVVVARGQIADPNFVNKIKENKINQIRYCFGCNQGCYDYFTKALKDPNVVHISCSRNPAVLEEETLSLKPTKNPKTILIIGGGIAGMEAAVDLKLTGNDPIIIEQEDHLGGQALLAGVAPGKQDFKNAILKYIKCIEELKIKVLYHTKFNLDLMDTYKAKYVIFATGSHPVQLKLDASNKMKIITSDELLKHPDLYQPKSSVVIGGGLTGLECAELLSSKGSKVNVIELKDKIMEDLGDLRKISTKISLATNKIEVHTSSACKKINDNEVIYVSDNQDHQISCDLVVTAVGCKANLDETLNNSLKERGINTYVIGDSKKAPGTILQSIYDAYMLVLELNNK